MQSYLDLTGYNIEKSSLSSEQIKKIKNDLTVVPKNNFDNINTNTNYKIYSENDNIITIPRYYGIEKFKNPKKIKFNPEKTKIKFTGDLRDYQLEIIDKCMKNIKKSGGGLLVVPCGMGKCLGKDTPVMIYNGLIKMVQDIKVNEQLMGDDSSPRIVLSICHGSDDLYSVKGDFNKYICNKSHILSLKWMSKNIFNYKNNNYYFGDTIDISVENYLEIKDNFIYNNLKGYRVSVEFQNNYNIDQDPYLFGYYSKQYNNIPDEYKFNSMAVRLELLKGIVYSSGIFKNNTYIINIKNNINILFLILSLGINYDYYDHDKIIISHDFNTSSYLVYTIFVEHVGIGEYFGFELTGNGRFLLDDFTVTHNTTMSIYMASLLGYKTLVITHKTFLQDQWIERCKQFTKSSVGIIRQDKVDVEKHDFVIAMIQSLSKRNYEKNIFKQFGLVIVDECHHVASKHFSKALTKTGTLYTIGLSATPYRNDGLIRVVNWYLGNIMYQKKLATNNQVVVKILTFFSNNILFEERTRFITGTIRPDCVKMITNLTLLEERNKHIINIINELRKDSNRKILILSGRKAHLKLLKDSIDESIEKDIKNNKILENEITTCYYTGDVKKDNRQFAEQNGDILFGTYDMAQEGLDIDRLNTIILASPKKDIIQAVGRILRKVLKNGDIRPVIIDITDNLSVFKFQAIQRKRFYFKSKYLVQNYYCFENKLVSYHKYLDSIGETHDQANKDVPTLKTILSIPPVEIINGKFEPEPDKELELDNQLDKKPKKNIYGSCLF